MYGLDNRWQGSEPVAGLRAEGPESIGGKIWEVWMEQGEGNASARLQVNTEELVRQSEEIVRYRKELQGQFERLEEMINSSGNFWIGEGGNEARRKYRAKKEQTGEILRRFEEHVEDLKKMAGVYEETEVQAEHIVWSLPTGILD